MVLLWRPRWDKRFCTGIQASKGRLWWLTGKKSAAKQETWAPWIRKIPWRRKWQPTPVFLPGEFHGQRSLVGYSSRGCKESNITEWLNMRMHACAHTHTHTHIVRRPGAASLWGFTRRSVHSLLFQSHWAASCGDLYLVSPWSSNHLPATPGQSYPQASGNGDWQGGAPLTFTNPSQAWNWSFLLIPIRTTEDRRVWQHRECRC